MGKSRHRTSCGLAMPGRQLGDYLRPMTGSLSGVAALQHTPIFNDWSTSYAALLYAKVYHPVILMDKPHHTSCNPAMLGQASFAGACAP